MVLGFYLVDTIINKNLFITATFVGLILSLGCSAGSLIVQVAPPTPTRFKTPRPTFTFTPNWTATFTPSPTPTETHTPTPTATQLPSPTPTEMPEEAPPPAPVAQEQAAPAAPTDTPTPEPPTATPTPEFPFQFVYFIHDTGSPGETRMTAWIRKDSGPGLYKTLSDFQMQALAPDGNTYLSEMSGPGFGDSTVKGTGDNHNMNTKLEFAPYTPGTYTIFLMEGGVQVSPDIEITINAEPQQYVHFDFFQEELQ